MNDFSYHFLMIHEARHGAHYRVRPLLVSQGNYSIRSLGESHVDTREFHEFTFTAMPTEIWITHLFIS